VRSSVSDQETLSSKSLLPPYKLDNLAGWPVTASPHRTLNTCKEVVMFAPLIDCDREEALSHKALLTSSTSLSKKTQEVVETRNTFIITFRTPTVPQHLTVGYLRVSVSRAAR